MAGLLQSPDGLWVALAADPLAFIQTESLTPQDRGETIVPPGCTVADNAIHTTVNASSELKSEPDVAASESDVPDGERIETGSDSTPETDREPLKALHDQLAAVGLTSVAENVDALSAEVKESSRISPDLVAAANQAIASLRLQNNDDAFKAIEMLLQIAKQSSDQRVTELNHHLQRDVARAGRRNAVLLGCLSLGGIVLGAFLAPFAKGLLADGEDLDGTVLSKVTGIVSVNAKANSMLPQLAGYIDRARSEIWIVGVSFYITIPERRSEFLAALARGVNVRFLLFDFVNGAVDDVAEGFGQTRQELTSECVQTIAALTELMRIATAQALDKPRSGRLEARFFKTEPRTRFYFFDPQDQEGFTYFVPHVDHQNSPNLPGYLARNVRTGVVPPYFEGVKSLWNASADFEEWSKLYVQ